MTDLTPPAGFDWRLFFTTFGTIFVAELGDKTQFAAVAAASQSRSVAEVLVGVVLGLSLAGVLGVGAGRLLATIVSPNVMRYVSGGLFIAVGIWVLARRG